MKRGIVSVLLVAVAAAALAIGTALQAQGGAQAAPKVVDVEKLRDNLFMLKGGGGNTSVFIASNGVVVVDTKNPGWGQPILDQIKVLTNKPVTTIINTHTHGDHVSGNVEFPASVDIVVQENTRSNMEKMVAPSPASAQPPAATIFQQNNGRGMPKRTFKNMLTIGSGADEIDLYYFGRGHTNGDAWVVFPSLRVVHAADIFSGKNIPLLDANNGGSAVAIPNSLAKAYATLTNVDTIITGHSTTMTRKDLNEYIAFNLQFLSDVRAAKQAGKSVDEVAATWKIPAKYAGYAEPAPARLKSNIQIAYDEIDAGVTR